ncbi:MAG: NADH-quinone oxidoreductase subunit J [candidate division Zixibacteria bacterium]|nr:NADH-quinone oxidoreductase subunit J [candidate division Zixibacteria bacterium]
MAEHASVGIMFWILAIVVVVSGFLVVSLRNIFHCALFLMLCLTAVAGIFITLDAEFLAVAQVLIYVGAVSVLMIFAIMLTRDLADKQIPQTNKHAMLAFLGCTAFVLGIILVLSGTDMWRWAKTPLPVENVMTIGKLLMTKYVLPFEVISILLVAAMIGAIVLARKEKA